MLKLNIARVLHLRGIYDTNEYLRGLGYLRNKVIRLAKDRLEAFNRYDMERICLNLNCTPNDLLEWHPSQKTNVADDHALRALERRKAALGVVELVQALPVEEVEAVQRFIPERAKR